MQVMISCPYCGQQQPQIMDDAPGYEVVLCYPEDGGCDQYFVVKLKLLIEYETYKLEKHND